LVRALSVFVARYICSVTGKLIGNLVAGRISNAALTAFRANRF
jgi:hypothetical protein